MRRMLDPKEVGGGGGDEKLYCHCISFRNDGTNKGGYIMLNYYSKKKDKFTYATFKNEFSNDKHVACSGYIQNGDNYFTALYLQLAANGPYTEINALYNDAVRNRYDLCALKSFLFEDYISEVN